MKQYLGIDIGGTNVKIGVISGAGDVIARGLIETLPEQGAARAFRRIHAAARVLAPDGIEAVGIGCAGLFDERRGRLAASPNLKAWEGAPLARIASAHFSVPILIQNDANCAAYGESTARGARGRNLVLITLGTGVGGGIVMDGRIVRGVNGFAGEIGHLTVDPEGPLCHCGSRGCLEAFAGSYAIKQTARRLMRRRSGAASRLPVWRIFQAARAREPWARETVRITGEHLGVAVATLLNTLNPSHVVIGGGVSHGFALLEPHVRRAVARHAFRETILAARIERARLGNDAGMVGAAMLVRDAIGRRHPRR
jgi:glucokinase